jgi:HK97 family phage major capsid protein
VYELMANELVNNPYISFAAMSAVEGAKAVTRKLEYDMLAAASSPHAGVVAASTAQTTMASATFALIGAFLKECIADNAYAINPTNNCLFLHPRDAITLALQAVGATELTGMLVWGDPRRGIPTTLLGYEVVIHPGCNNGTNNYAFLGDPKNIILAEAPSYMIDFSDQVGFLKFQTAMRVGSHYDYIVKQTTEWHRAIVTA